MLKEDLAEDRNVARSTLYLARSYEAVGDRYAAIAYWNKVVRGGGWGMETSHAHLRLADLGRQLGAPWGRELTHFLDAMDLYKESPDAPYQAALGKTRTLGHPRTCDRL